MKLSSFDFSAFYDLFLDYLIEAIMILLLDVLLVVSIFKACFVVP